MKNFEVSGSIYEDDQFVFIKYSFNRPSLFNNSLFKSNLEDRDEQIICIDKTTSTESKFKNITGKFITDFYGIFGCIKFTSGPYLIVITGRKCLGNLFMKYPIYTINDIIIIPLFIGNGSDVETKYLELFKSVDLTKDFYYSHTYTICDTVQNNYSVHVKDADYGLSISDKFVYNQFHLECLKMVSDELLKYSVQVIHGYLSIIPISLSGRMIELYLISRRSRHYAGTRYRKRGINSEGHVANEVQTEIVLYDSTHSNSIMSFVQLRGSIPLFWAQKLPVSILKKPPIVYPLNDGTFSSTRRHFNYLFAQYGAPIICLNLLSDDLENDEGQLSLKFSKAIQKINMELPQSFHIQYIHRDLRNYQLFGKCEQMMTETARYCIDKTGIFHIKNNQILSIQSGIVRSSCLDCLDRTNTVIQRVSLVAVANMLHKINVLYTPDLSNDQIIAEAIKINIDSMGDRLSLQYGGSRVLKKYEADQTMVDQSAQLLTIFKRRYKNSFGDADKQVSINLFLGILNPLIHCAPWEQDLDVILHTKYIPEFCGNDWYVLALQLFYNRFRTLSPFVSSDKCETITILSPFVNGKTLDWFIYYSGNPQKCPFTTKITYIPWWILKLSTNTIIKDNIFISKEYNLQYFIDNFLYNHTNDNTIHNTSKSTKKPNTNVDLPALSKYITENDFSTDDNKMNVFFDQYPEPQINQEYTVQCNVWDESNYENLFKNQLKFEFISRYSGLYKI